MFGIVEETNSAQQLDISTSADPVASNIASAKPTTDILLIGRTGMGKSTTGNKLLQVGGHEPDEWFQTGFAGDSVTKNCEILTNDTVSLRIVDVPGFAPSDTQMKGMNTYQANLRIMREILLIQEENGLRFHRIIYFFPARGELPRADATFKEEVSVMHYFFGDAIFQNMILVATARPKKSKKNELDDEDLEAFMTAYRSAYKEVAKEAASNISSERPAIYISLEDTPDDILKAIMSQEVGIPDGVRITITKSVCAKCALRLHVHDGHGMRTFAYYGDDERVKYEDTKCHPVFVRKWSRAAKNLGGVACIVTFGIVYGLGIPWFSNATEICVHCRNIPGTEGCKQVGTLCAITFGKGETTKTSAIVKHTNEVECL